MSIESGSNSEPTEIVSHQHEIESVSATGKVGTASGDFASSMSYGGPPIEGNHVDPQTRRAAVFEHATTTKPRRPYERKNAEQYCFVADLILEERWKPPDLRKSDHDILESLYQRYGKGKIRPYYYGLKKVSDDKLRKGIERNRPLVKSGVTNECQIAVQSNIVSDDKSSNSSATNTSETSKPEQKDTKGDADYEIENDHHDIIASPLECDRLSKMPSDQANTFLSNSLLSPTLVDLWRKEISSQTKCDECCKKLPWSEVKTTTTSTGRTVKVFIECDGCGHTTQLSKTLKLTVPWEELNFMVYLRMNFRASLNKIAKELTNRYDIDLEIICEMTISRYFDKLEKVVMSPIDVLKRVGYKGSKILAVDCIMVKIKEAREENGTESLEGSVEFPVNSLEDIDEDYEDDSLLIEVPKSDVRKPRIDRAVLLIFDPVTSAIYKVALLSSTEKSLKEQYIEELRAIIRKLEFIPNLVISDPEVALVNAVREVLPGIKIQICLAHVWRQIQKLLRVKNRMKDEVIREQNQIFRARIRRMFFRTKSAAEFRLQFELIIRHLRAEGGVYEKVANILTKHGRELYNFFDYRGAPRTNNTLERKNEDVRAYLRVIITFNTYESASKYLTLLANYLNLAPFTSKNSEYHAKSPAQRGGGIVSLPWLDTSVTNRIDVSLHPYRYDKGFLRSKYLDPFSNPKF